MERVRWLASAALVVTILCGGAEPARAQDDPRKAEAEALYQEGLKLHDKDREAEALEKFQRSYALYPSPNTLVGVARAEQLVGRPLDAIRHYREALKQPLLNPKWATLARQYVAELEGKLARVFVTGPSGTKVTVGTVTLRLPMEEPLDVDAGALTVRGEHEGVTLSGTGQAAPGKVTTIELKSEAGTPATANPPASQHLGEPPQQVDTPGSFWGWRSIGGIAVAGVGAALLGWGIASTIEESNEGERATDLRGRLPTGSACEGVSSPECADLNQAISNRDSASARAVPLLVGGGVAVAAGVGLIVSAAIWPHAKSRQSGVAPMFGPNVAGLTLVRSF